ncbi:hypothetical protein ACPEIF_23790 [Streptomyces sp. NPDC012600]|uniref:Uncharacterized protein n=1 Tax=Streptomyces stephensoniae TaxID=3375367 RepID=A0ABU2W181_9ACTN|nr:hypothetical protein [Streptomyces griseus]MDT0491616.1 hypothetical protein [Streptomyces griseus]
MKRRSTVLRRAVEAGLIAALTVAALPTAAQALNVERTWNGTNNPLKVTGYGSTGHAWGTWKVGNTSNGTRSIVNSYTKLNNADNHKVYVELQTQVNAGYCVQASKYMNCTQKYWNHATAETAHHSSKSYTFKSASTGVKSEADYARGMVRARLDIPYRTDPATGWSYTDGGDKY